MPLKSSNSSAGPVIQQNDGAIELEQWQQYYVVVENKETCLGSSVEIHLLVIWEQGLDNFKGKMATP